MDEAISLAQAGSPVLPVLLSSPHAEAGSSATAVFPVVGCPSAGPLAKRFGSSE